jgi:hypothetical protein
MSASISERIGAGEGGAGGLLAALIRRALTGDVRAIRLIFDRVDGGTS